MVMAWSVDRLGRSLQDLVGFLSELHALTLLKRRLRPWRSGERGMRCGGPGPLCSHSRRVGALTMRDARCSFQKDEGVADLYADYALDGWPSTGGKEGRAASYPE
jgi:hypothetical protein